MTLLRPLLDNRLTRVSISNQDPFELINEHIKLQKRGNPLLPFLDTSLRSRIATLESNLTEDVSVGSVMQDKSKIVKVYTDMKLDMNLL